LAFESTTLAILPPEHTEDCYVSDFNHDRVVVYDNVGAFIGDFAAEGLNGPRGVHVEVTRRELAEFVLGKSVPTNGRDPLVDLDGVLDRSHLIGLNASVPDAMKLTEKTKYNSGLEHWPRSLLGYGCGSPSTL